MGLLTTKTMTNTTPDPIDWNTIIQIGLSIFGGLVAWIYLVNAWFKSKREEKKEWIEQIATASVNAAMDSCLKDVRRDVQTLFRHREDDRKHLDDRLDFIVTEIRKP